MGVMVKRIGCVLAVGLVAATSAATLAFDEPPLRSTTSEVRALDFVGSAQLPHLTAAYQSAAASGLTPAVADPLLPEVAGSTGPAAPVAAQPLGPPVPSPTAPAPNHVSEARWRAEQLSERFTAETPPVNAQGAAQPAPGTVAGHGKTGTAAPQVDDTAAAKATRLSSGKWEAAARSVSEELAKRQATDKVKKSDAKRTLPAKTPAKAAKKAQPTSNKVAAKPKKSSKTAPVIATKPATDTEAAAFEAPSLRTSTALQTDAAQVGPKPAPGVPAVGSPAAAEWLGTTDAATNRAVVGSAIGSGWRSGHVPTEIGSFAWDVVPAPAP